MWFMNDVPDCGHPEMKRKSWDSTYDDVEPTLLVAFVAAVAAVAVATAACMCVGMTRMRPRMRRWSRRRHAIVTGYCGLYPSFQCAVRALCCCCACRVHSSVLLSAPLAQQRTPDSAADHSSSRKI